MVMALADYPPVLCGPMLRRVTDRSVSVFVALREQAAVKLTIHDDPAAGSGSTPIEWHPGFQYPATQTVPLGANLHVALATVTIPQQHAGIDIAGLTPGVGYGYDITIEFDSPAGSSPQSLADLDLLTGDHAHGYEDGRLPGFTLAPEHAEDLHVVHGSCRKPHGQGADMLADLDQYLQAPVTGGPRYRAAGERPHLLLLTGDQIYADDVDPILLRVLHDASRTLLGWDETLPETGNANPEPTIVEIKDAAAAVMAAGSNQAADALAELDTIIRDRLDDVDFTPGSAASNQTVGRMLRGQLEGFADRATFITENQVMDDAGRDTESRVLAEIIESWLDQHIDIFGNLSSSHSWGRVAITATGGDEAVVDAVLALLEGVDGSTVAATLADSITVAAPDHRPIQSRELTRILDQLTDDLKALDGGASTAEIDAITVPIRDLFRPGGGSNPKLSFIASRISPPQRANELRQHTGLSSQAMQAHLMFFGEFALMYVLAWSPAAWPEAEGRLDLPEFFDAVPNYAKFAAFGPAALKAARTALGALPRPDEPQDDEHPAPFQPNLAAVRRVMANIPTLMIFDDHEVSDDWNLNADWVANMSAKPAGRQVLRNALVAYGIFQDWGNRPDDYTGVADATELDNELTASPTTLLDLKIGPLLLDGVRSTVDTAPDGTQTRTSRLLDENAQQVLDSRLGIGSGVATNLPPVTAGSVATGVPPFAVRSADGAYASVPSVGRKQWDWSYEPTQGADWRIIALDTRTHRAFPTEQWALTIGLTWEQAESGDLTPDSGGFVAAANLLAPGELDRQLDARLRDDRLNIVISPAPVFGLPLLEDYVQRLFVLQSSPESADYESWVGNPHGFESLLNVLRDSAAGDRRVLLLSGDVHYGFSNRMVTTVGGPSIEQVCSSSLKNETPMTRTLAQITGSHPLPFRLFRFEDGELALETWQSVFEQLVETGLSVGEGVGDLVSDLTNLWTWLWETSPFLNPTNPQAWTAYWLALKDSKLLDVRWQLPSGLLAVGSGLWEAMIDDLFDPDSGETELDIERLSDDRPIAERRAQGKTLELVGGPSIDDLHLPNAKMDEQRDIVGFNNVGLLRFDSSPGSAVVDRVSHDLLWRTHDSRGEPESPHGVTRHGGRGAASGLHEAMARYAEREYARWHPGAAEAVESDRVGQTLLAEYWATMRVHRDPDLAAVDEFTVVDDGSPVRMVGFWYHYGRTGNTLAWSATFLSWVVHRAGGGDRLFSSPRHIDYLRAAKAATDPAVSFVLLDRDAAVPQVGDITVAWRETAFTIDDIETEHTASFRAAHCEIVVEASTTSITVIGGNVDQTVARRTVDLAPNGRLPAGPPHQFIGLLRTAS